MKKLIILLILLLAISLSAIELDKILHFIASYSIYDVSHDYLNTTELSMDKIEGYSFWIAFGAGIGKEFYDVSQGGIFSEIDLAYDLGGILVAMGLNRHLRHLEYKRMIIILNKDKVNVGVRF